MIYGYDERTDEIMLEEDNVRIVIKREYLEGIINHIHWMKLSKKEQDEIIDKSFAELNRNGRVSE